MSYQIELTNQARNVLDEIYSYIESPEKVDYQLFSPFIANEAKQKYKKQAIIFLRVR